MLLFHETALYIHIAVGACALLLFWVPIFTRKGNLDHKRFGRFFAMGMYTVSISGIVMSSLDLMFPVAMHAPGLELTPERAAEVGLQVREFGLFLFSLSILVLTSTRHGWLAILHRDDRTPLRHPIHLGLNALLVTVGIVLLIVGINTSTILFMIFGPLQIVAGLTNLRYIFRNEIRPKEWWIQHLSGLIGSGIGAYTAFAVFGGRTMFEQIFASNFESYSVFLWITPGIVGTIAINVWSRKYIKQFGGSWITKRAEVRSELFQ